MPLRDKLVRESEWMRVYESDRSIQLYESKFLADGLQVAADTIIRRWPEFSAEQRLDFVNAFACKPEVTAEDERILDFLMEQNDFYIWMGIAPLLPHHRNRERVLAFVLDTIREHRKHAANLLQALELMGDKRAVPALRAAYEDYKKQLNAKGSPPDYDRYVDYLVCSKALWVLDGSLEYKEVIESFADSEDSYARAFARRFLRDR